VGAAFWQACQDLVRSPLPVSVSFARARVRALLLFGNLPGIRYVYHSAVFLPCYDTT